MMQCEEDSAGLRWLGRQKGHEVRNTVASGSWKRRGMDSQIFLVIRWLRILLLMQETWVQSLFLEDSTCHRAMKPMGCNF